MSSIPDGSRRGRLLVRSAVVGVCLSLLPFSLASAQRVELRLTSNPDLTCVGVNEGEEFEVTAYFMNTTRKTINLGYISLGMSTDLKVTGVRGHDTEVTLLSGDGYYKWRVGWDRCRDEVCLPMMTLTIQATDDVSDAWIWFTRQRFQGCYTDDFFVSRRGFVVNPSSGCVPGGDATVLTTEVTAALLPDQTKSVWLDVQNEKAAPQVYELRAVCEGPEEDWIVGTMAGIVEASNQSSIPVTLTSSGLTPGTYYGTVDVISSCDGGSLGSVDVTMVVASPSPTANGIGLYFDDSASDCDTQASEGDMVELYVFGHLRDYWMAAAEFSVNLPAGVQYLGESYGPDVAVTNGNVIDGLQLALGSCRPGPLVYLARVMLMVTDPVSEADFHVLPHPVSSFLGFAECNDQRTLRTVEGGFAVINGDCTIEVGTQEESWGTIKAMYRSVE
jgi:hypothetical protein